MIVVVFFFCFFFQAEDGIRDLVRSRGLGDVYKRQLQEGDEQRRREDYAAVCCAAQNVQLAAWAAGIGTKWSTSPVSYTHLTPADERSSVDLGGRRIIKKKNTYNAPYDARQ